MKVAVIGAGAAGFFAAIHAREFHPEALVVLFEKTNKPLAKVKISGGGRCNVTNGCEDIPTLVAGYPRGARQLRKAFHQFNNQDTMHWFESRGVPLHTELDNRVFPQTNKSQSIIDCLVGTAKKLGVDIRIKSPVQEIEPKGERFLLKGPDLNEHYDKIIIATGGSPKRSGLEWLADLGHKINDPVPSLFTFNMPKHPITELMGVVAPNAQVKIAGTKLRSEGPLLITHWGMSGPAILKLSAFGARVLAEKNYQFEALIDWSGIGNLKHLEASLETLIERMGHQKIVKHKFIPLPDRLWRFLLQRIDVDEHRKWGELGKKGFHKMLNLLGNDAYPVKGKTTFKEEFVTSGGVSLESINFKTMESRVVPGMFFAGEIMDVDGITGGYNFQAAWTTGYIAGKLRGSDE